MPPAIMAKLLVGNDAAQTRGCIQLYEIAGADGVAVLEGGVRGWAEVLGCGRGYPKALLEGLRLKGAILGVEFYPGRGGQVAEVHLQLQGADSISDQNIAPEPPPADHAAPHQDAANDPQDRSLIATPPTPLYGTDPESIEQQQHDRAHARSDEPPSQAAQWVEWAHTQFPAVEPGVIARIAADPGFDAGASTRALTGRPNATLREFAAELHNAHRPGTRTPIGLLLAVWRDGGVVTPPAAPAARPSPLVAAVRRRREEFDPNEARAQIARLGGVTNPPPTSPPPARASPPMPPPGRSLGPIWQAVLDRLGLPRQERDTWFTGAALIALDGSTATIRASSLLQQEGLEHRYLVALRRALGDVVGYPVAPQIVTRQAAAAAV